MPFVVSMHPAMPLVVHAFQAAPSWLRWPEEGDGAPIVAGQELVITRRELSGAGVTSDFKVKLSSLSVVHRFESRKAPQGAYYIPNVILQMPGEGGPRLGELSVRLQKEGYSVGMTRYESDGHLQIVALDGGGFDVKRRGSGMR